MTVLSVNSIYQPTNKTVGKHSKFINSTADSYNSIAKLSEDSCAAGAIPDFLLRVGFCWTPSISTSADG